MLEIVAGDIGGTNASFERDELRAGSRPRLGSPRTYNSADFPDLPSAWRRFVAEEGIAPAAASLAVAAPIDGDLLRFTNSPWMIEASKLSQALGVDQVLLLNDFGAIGHAIAWLAPDEFLHIAGPQTIPDEGVTTIIGPGTGLGVAILLHRNGRYEVIETEGGHFDFAPLDSVEEQMLRHLRERFLRVSVERLVSGPGLRNLYETLGAIEQLPVQPRDDASLWRAAIEGSDPLARSALDRFVLTFGSAAGDLALAHGAKQVVIVGGLSGRIREWLQRPSFHASFCAKGRYAARMAQFPIRLALHEQPGLLGAAAAYQSQKI